MFDRMTRARLSAQRALLGEISPALRAVTLSLTGPCVEVRCYFDGKVSEEDSEAMSCVETEMIADCAPGESVRLSVVQANAPDPLDDAGIAVYRRKEH